MTNAISETIIPVSNPEEVLQYFVAHVKEEHGMDLDTSPDGGRYMEGDGFRFDLRAESRGVHVRVEGPNEGVLIFFKEDLAEHVAELDPTAAANIRWTGETAVVGALPSNFKVLSLVGSGPVFPGLHRVTLAHDDVSSLAAGGVHLRLMMPLEPGRTPEWPRMAANGTPVWPQGENKLHARTITLRHVRPEDGEVDIDVVSHDQGMISNWSLRAQPGDTVGIMGPAGLTLPPHSQHLFLAADGTGLPALARLIDDLPEDATGDAVVAVADAYDPANYLPTSLFRIHKLPPDRFEAEVVTLSRSLTTPGVTQYGFFAGEFQNAQDMRMLFKEELGLQKSDQLSSAYWRRGVPGYGA